jgi:PIN domain nuclease of toxin-antitoxin system
LKLLLDTHIAFWLASDRQKLTAQEWALLQNPDVDLFLSAVAIWELRLKWSRLYPSGVPKGPISPLAALAVFTQLKLPIIPLMPEIAAAPLNQPMLHKDPFDELLLVHAQELDMRLLTRDGKLKDHPLAISA